MPVRDAHLARVARVADTFRDPGRWLKLETMSGGTVYIAEDAADLAASAAAIRAARDAAEVLAVLATLAPDQWWVWRAGYFTDAAGRCTYAQSRRLADAARPRVNRRGAAPAVLLPPPAA